MDPSSLDDAFRALAASRRRAICRYFRSSGDDVADFDDLVEFVVEAERAERADDRPDHRKEVAVDLHHVHLPQLSDVGVVEFDPVRGSVQYSGSAALDLLLGEITNGDAVRA